MSNPDDIVTRCPQCNTAFRVTLNQLAVADGQVRCGSCLAVFKAVDHDALKETTLKSNVSKPEESRPPVTQKEYVDSVVTAKTSLADSLKAAMNTASKPSNILPTDTSKSFKTPTNTQEVSSLNTQADELAVKKTEIKQSPSPTSKQPKTSFEPQSESEKPAAADLDDELISDDNKQNTLDLDGDIFDISSENNNKTSLFDRRLNEVKEHRRESADESWAVKMLAELEDEEKEDKQDKTFFITEPKPQSLKNKKNDLIDDYEVKIEPSPSADDDLDDKSNTSVNSSVDSIALTTDLDTDHDSDLNDNKDDYKSALSFDYDDTNHDDNQGATNESSSLDSAQDIEGAAKPEQHKTISDDEIESAMSSRARYQDDAKNYLANIEPAPVEMMDFSSPSAQRWLWRAGAIITAILLLIQIAVMRFDSLSKDPSYRPIYSSACKIVGCVLPPLIDTQKIRTTNLIVRSHPRLQNALIIDAILINNAKFSQAFPALQLDFNDINDKLVASRQLQPDEYLRGELAGAKQMANNQPIQLSIEIVDPGDDAVNYQLTVVQARPTHNKN
jgi:predicted Zn finger-like uncharacterized protein